MADTPSSSSSSPPKITVYGASWRPDCRRGKKFLMSRFGLAKASESVGKRRTDPGVWAGMGRSLGRNGPEFGPEWAGVWAGMGRSLGRAMMSSST